MLCGSGGSKSRALAAGPLSQASRRMRQRGGRRTTRNPALISVARPRSSRSCSTIDAIIAHVWKQPAHVALFGQSRQRRTLAQHGPSGLGAVAGAASRTSVAAAAHRGRERRVGVEVALGEDAECRL